MKTTTFDTLWQLLPVCAEPRLRRWLLDRGSLTLRIQLRCDDFRLDLLSQHTAAVDRGERAVLGVRAGVQCVVREVSLNCGRRPVVFAHSVVESRALRGPGRILITLAARPLCAPLFADPRLHRYPLH